MLCFAGSIFTMLNEFKKFIMRGNVLYMAVGIILGTAFLAIVRSFVNDIIMPPIGLLKLLAVRIALLN